MLGVLQYIAAKKISTTMSQKAEFRFEFPKLGTEYKALANPMHIEPVTAIVMEEHKTDLCIVYFADTLQFICRYTEKPNSGECPFQFFYQDKSKREEIHLLLGGDEANWYTEGGMEAVMEHCSLSDGDNIIERGFNSCEEANAFVSGVDTVMSMMGREDEYAFISEDDWYKWRTKVNGE